MSECAHVNAYRDDFLGQLHCDDCGALLDNISAVSSPEDRESKTADAPGLGEATSRPGATTSRSAG